MKEFDSEYGALIISPLFCFYFSYRNDSCRLISNNINNMISLMPPDKWQYGVICSQSDCMASQLIPMYRWFGWIINHQIYYTFMKIIQKHANVEHISYLWHNRIYWFAMKVLAYMHFLMGNNYYWYWLKARVRIHSSTESCVFRSWINNNQRLEFDPTYLVRIDINFVRV